MDAKVAQAQLDLEVRRVRESKDLDVEKKVKILAQMFLNLAFFCFW